MRRVNWTPSIVPNGNDQTVYLVADDFGKPGVLGSRPIMRPSIQKPSSRTCSPASTATRSGSSLSTPSNAGPKTFPTSRARTAPALRSPDARHLLLPSGVYRPLRQSASRHPASTSDALGLTMAFQRRKPAASGVKALFPGFIEPSLATSIEKVPSGQRWLHEIKFDGYRVQVHLANEAVKVYTRRGNEWTKRFKKTPTTPGTSRPDPRSSTARSWSRQPMA
jgi:hypothetical protein